MNTSSHAAIGCLRSLLHRQQDAAEDDRELLRRFILTRDDDAFALLMRQHGPMVLGLAHRIVEDSQLAEDVFQATFLLLARKAATIRRPLSLSCWLHGVAHRLAVQARRSRSNRRRHEACVRPISPPTLLDDLTVREFLSLLDEELRRLPEKNRAPLNLCCLEGLSQEEAANRLGCSPGAVKGRLERGRNQLRLRLEKRGLTLPALLGGMLLIDGSIHAVPAALMHSTLHVAKTGTGATMGAAAMLQGAMRSMVLNKLKALSAAVLLLALTGTGVGMMALREPAEPAVSAPSSLGMREKSPEKRVDLYGDPLPQGVAMRLGTVQRRAIGASLSVSADGKSVLSVRAGKYLRIWDTRTGKLREQRELPGDSFNSLAEFSPDGRLLAIHNDSTAEMRIWDIPAGKIVRTLPLKNDSVAAPRYVHVQSLAFSPDGTHIAAVDNNGEKHRIHVWDAKSGKETFCQDFQQGNGVTDRLVLAGDEKRLFAIFVSIYTGLRCWDIAGGRQTWQRDDLRPYAIAVTPDGKILCSGQRSQIQAVDLATGRTMELTNPFAIDRYAHLKLTPDGRTLLIADEKGVAVWDWRQGKQLRMLAGAGEDIAVLPDGKSIITNDGSLQRWDLATGQGLWPDTFDRGHVGEVLALAFSADGRRLASGSGDGSVRLWDAVTGRPLRVWRGHAARRPIRLYPWVEAGATSVDITPNGLWIVSAGSDDRLKLWDANADKEVHTIVASVGVTGFAPPLRYHVRIDRDGERAVVLFGPFLLGQPPKCINKLATWNLKTGELLANHSVELESGAFYTLSADGRLARMNNVLVDVASGKEMVCLSSMQGNTGSISRDGALVASIATGRGGLCVWEWATGKLVSSLKEIGWTGQIFFHPANHLVATNDLDGIQLWDVRSGARVAQFHAPEPVRVGMTMDRNISCLAFTPDGRRLATGMPDGTILFWDVPLPPSRPEPLAAKELERLCVDLADADAAKAWRAIWRMSEAPDALSFLRGRLKPVPIAPAELTHKLLADLDGDSFEGREAAVKRLKELGPQAEPALRAVLQTKPSLEQKRRIETLLAELAVLSPPTPKELRQLRAVIVLERIDSPEARQLLEELAKGPESAPLTRQAMAALREGMKR